MPHPRRVLLKLSGEALAGPENRFPIDYEALHRMGEEIAAVRAEGVQIAIVVGGGNIVRGAEASKHGITAVGADHMGMMATIINGIAIQNVLEKIIGSDDTRLLSAIETNRIAEPFIQRRAVRHLERDRIVIFAAGTGNPTFTTDTAAALRAVEIGADLLAKATNIDGVHDKDPRAHADAQRLDTVSYARCIRERLNVMDMTAFTHCEQHRIPIRIFSIREPGNIRRALLGESIGTLVSADE